MSIARKLGKQNILFLGASAGQLPSTEELRGVIENKAALFANTPRTQTMARVFAATAQTRSQSMQIKDGTTFMAADLKTRLPSVVALNGVEQEESPFIEVGRNKALASFDHPELYVQYGIMKALSGVELPKSQSVSITISKEQGRLVFTSPGVDALICQAFKTDPDLVTAARVLVEGSKKKYTFAFSTNATGVASVKDRS